MRKDLKITVKREAIALIGDITYKNEAAWYGESERPLKMSLLVPKHKERHAKPLPLLLWLCGGGPVSYTHLDVYKRPHIYSIPCGVGI